MKVKGFTLIGVIIVVAIISILAAIVTNFSEDRTICINGYVFAKGHSSNVTQILDDQGHGIRCEVK